MLWNTAMFKLKRLDNFQAYCFLFDMTNVLLTIVIEDILWICRSAEAGIYGTD